MLVTPDSATSCARGWLPRLAALAGVSLVLLGLAGGTAWWLARRTVAPLRDLEETANAVAAGDLTARAPAFGINEIENVGVALNRLTGRVQELLHEEREYTAELAHQLRTPLTVLSVDVDGVTDPTVRERLRTTCRRCTAWSTRSSRPPAAPAARACRHTATPPPSCASGCSSGRSSPRIRAATFDAGDPRRADCRCA